MTEKRHFGHAARLLAALLMLTATPAAAQDDVQQGPAAAPDRAPVSRLTVTPSEFERWLAGRPEEPDLAVPPDDRAPGLVAPPPPPPSLVTPPPPPALTPPPASASPKAPVALPRTHPDTPAGATGSPPTAAPAPTTPLPPTTPPSAAPPEVQAATPEPGSVSPPAPPVLAPPEPPQVATLPPDSRDTTPVPAPPEPLARPEEIRILYAVEATDLPKEARADLDRMAAWLRANPEVRVQIVGYASEPTRTGSQARRRSLFRTLAVRTYLIENGVLSTRMDVRAMGDRTEEEPKDRVEVRLPPS